MAIAKFTKVVSFFKTTLSSRITDSATDVTLDAVPAGAIQYPTWAVIDPNKSNVELIYLPSAPTGTSYASVVRGLDPEADVDTAGVGFASDHPAGVEVILAPTHRHWNELVKVMDGTVGTGANNLRIGDETAADVTIYAQNDQAIKAFFRYGRSDSKWVISNDGVSTYDIAAGGSGLTRGLGVDIQTSAITLDVRSGGGLRNNQGTGSQQCDVDPTIVARLDTANTWTAPQSATADNIQITTDPDSANDAVRKSYLDAQITAEVPKGGISGTSGEAITAGQGVYIKASDSKLYKTDADADESTFSFVGIALTTVAGADLAVEYAPPGHVVSGLAGLTAGAYYFVTGTSGTLGTTPGSRFARVGFAISTTQMQVLTPKYVVTGLLTASAVSSGATNTAVTGFYPANITFLSTSNNTASDDMLNSGGDFWAIGSNAGSLTQYTDASFLSNLKANSSLIYNTQSGSGTVRWEAAVSSKTATGFVVTYTNTLGGGTHTSYIRYTAESL